MVNIAANEAIVNVTWAGNNGDLRDPVSFDATEAEIRTWVTESVRTGGVANIAADPNANFEDFVVDRFAATDETPYNRIFLRPKTPFGPMDPAEKEAWLAAHPRFQLMFLLSSWLAR
jgi:hypothetical protein